MWVSWLQMKEVLLKRYEECMNEITAEEIYKGLLVYGMFPNRLPPIFSAESFGDYCDEMDHNFKDCEYDYIVFDAMRNTSVPRSLGVPNPMAYQRLCLAVKECWPDLQRHFRKCCSGQEYKVSRTHIRKMRGRSSLFEMNYDNWRVDGSPELDMQIGAKYVVRADIATCFPSIYTHALCWALVGKAEAKSHRDGKWYNKLDEACQQVRNGETHGLLIGPHASNLLAETILVAVDSKLVQMGWKYVRHIDDYACYVRSRDEAEQFVRSLAAELRKFDLSLNHKKTVIEGLPVPLEKEWKRQLRLHPLIAPYGKAGYLEVSAYVDLAVSLMWKSGGNVAVLNYAIKTLSGKLLTGNARGLCVRRAMHLALVYPYLIPLLEEYVFCPYSVSVDEIAAYARIMYREGRGNGNIEQCCYSVLYALKYSFYLCDIDMQDVLGSDNCVFKLMAWLYFRKNRKRKGYREALEALRQHALELYRQDMDRNWLFVFEVLPVELLSNEWKALKRNRVSFLKDAFR